MNLDRLARITDLFLEGRIITFGDDEQGNPVLVWVNKLNSFEDEEARRDGAAARSLRILGLSEDNPEVRAAKEDLLDFTREEMIQVVAAQNYDEDYLLAIDDVEADEDWNERREALRMTHLLSDSDVPQDDPRHEQMSKLNAEYVVAINQGTTERQAQRQVDLQREDHDGLTALFIKNWKTRVGLAEFFAEQRITQLFYALRDCTAEHVDGEWVHSRCDHKRLLNDRSQVRTLPEEMLERALETLAQLTVDRRTAGNSDVPTNSSESSEQRKQAEASTPSIPQVTAPGAHAT